MGGEANDVVEDFLNFEVCHNGLFWEHIIRSCFCWVNIPSTSGGFYMHLWASRECMQGCLPLSSRPLLFEIMKNTL